MSVGDRGLERVDGPHTRRAGAQGGFSIVELLVAIAIGGLLLAGAVSLFINNRAASQITQDLSRLQESGRFALETIISDLRMAGYFGCANDMTRLVPHANFTAITPGGILWDVSAPIEGLNDYSSGDGEARWLPSGYTDSSLNDLELVDGTDAITVRYLRARLPDNNILGSTSTTITVRGAGNMEDGQILGVADCGGVDIVQLCHSDATVCGEAGKDESGDDPVLTVKGNLSRSYNPDVSPVAAPLVGVRYSIALNDFGMPALYRTSISVAGDGSLSESNTELFEGVADMQLLYGVDTTQDGLADSFVTAGSANLGADTAQWRNIVSIKIGLLVQTVTERGDLLTQDLPDLLDKPLATFTDTRLRRRVFVTTAQIRNL